MFVRTLSLVFGVLLCCSAQAKDFGGESLDGASELRRLPATRLNLSKHDSPSSVTVITKAAILEHGYRSVAETLRAVPGFRVTQSSSGSYYISYQGYGAAHGRRMSIAIDNVPVMTADIRSIDWYRLPVTLDEVEQIIVTRGTNGSAFGDNAFLASINIITSNPEDVNSTTVSVGFGSEDSKSTFFRKRGAFRSTTYSAAISNESTDGFDKTGDGEERHDDIEITRGNWASTSDVSDSIRARLNVSYYESKRESVVDVPGQIDTKPVEAEEYLFSNKWEFDLSPRESIDLSVATSGDNEDYGNTACFPAIGFHRISNELYLLNPDFAKSFYLNTEYLGRPLTAQEQAVFNELTSIVAANYPESMARTCANFDLSRKGKSSEIETSYRVSWGELSSTVVGVSANRLSSTSDTYLGGTVNREYYRLFTETSYVNGRYTANVGGILENVSTFSKTEWGVRGSLNYHLMDTQTIRVEASRSFRFPSILESDRTFIFHPELLDPVPWSSADTAFALSNSSVDDRTPETIRSYAIGYVFTPSDHISSFDAKIFYNELRRVNSDPINLLIPSATILHEDFETSGVEFGASIAVSARISAEGTYSYIDNNADSVFERSLHSRHAGSAGIKVGLRENESISLNYYGNSPISGISYDRIDLIYFTRFGTEKVIDAQLGVQHLVSRMVGVRDVWPEGEVLSSYDFPNFFFGKLSVNFD